VFLTAFSIRVGLLGSGITLFASHNEPSFTTVTQNKQLCLRLLHVKVWQHSPTTDDIKLNNNNTDLLNF